MSMAIKDPIYSDFNINDFKWAFPLITSYPVNRLRFIKQLGLKAYDGKFPSANHTRYEHSIGTMYLSSKLCDKLYANTTDLDLKGCVNEYKFTIQIASLLHDVGHGAFSHVVDDILKRYFHIKHEKMTTKIIEEMLKDEIENLENHVESADVCQIIIGKHTKHSYLNDIVHGELDVDRMDYLARDAYFTGTEYRWGAQSLIDSMRISKIPAVSPKKIQDFKEEIRNSKLRNRNDIENAIDLAKDLWKNHVCIIGEGGVVLAEMLLVTRRTMYEKVYYETSSRIAEKMIERAIIWMLENHRLPKTLFSDLRKFVTLDDFELFSRMKRSKGYPSEILDRIKNGDFFEPVISKKVEATERLKEAVARDDQQDIQKMNSELAQKWKTDEERVLLDVVERQPFERDRVFVESNGKVKNLEDISPIVESLVQSMESVATFGVYVDKGKVKIEEDKLKKDIEDILG